MRYCLDPHHFETFQNQEYIEFEDLLTSEQLIRIREAVDKVVTCRVPKGTTKMTDLMDIWRDHEEVKKLAFRKGFNELAAQLFKVSPIRLAFDYAFVSLKSGQAFFEKDRALQDFSSLQNMAGALMICLEGSGPIEEEPVEVIVETVDGEELEPEIIVTLPMEPGNGTFFGPSCPIPFLKLMEQRERKFLLIAYVKACTVYSPCSEDPNLHSLKSLGYAYGDLIKDQTHPIVYR